MVCISQVPTWDANVDQFWVGVYWLSSAICLASSLHVLVCTVFINVFGGGLALRGPEGSMVRSVEGMIVEQNHILVLFAFTVAMFGIQMVGLFWMMMSQPLAIACSLGMLLGMVVWYHYCLRVFNSFKARLLVDARWQEQKTRFGDLDRQDPANFSQPSSVEGDGISHSGFLGLLRQKTRWQRVFCVVRRLPQVQLLVYRDRAAFLSEPGSPLFRPVEGPAVEAFPTPGAFLFSLKTFSGPSEEEEPQWEFRCDTASELADWLAALSP
eukprot:CAMPEP_0170076708 /NCGR_PEP_ID=MMETSP0019_2-20121128/13661_1 /TAXON_ID=98059 /ORGANISM="Dinobryon sp., Strain UTEXLB2267" /LENGTH=267 /DNA_ID=CAMNT_0010288579 /DNA_START=70 /DNA_END=873 /DNA_ORIENTATION=-